MLPGSSRKAPMSVEEPKSKRQRTSPGTSDKEVDIVSQYKNDGVVWSGTYTSSNAESKSMKDIKDRIKKDKQLRIKKSNELYDLYPAFKEALLRILMKIEDNDPEVGIILVHGAASIGKSSLAKCLAYFLSLCTKEKEAVNLIKLCHSATVDKSVLTGCITDACNENYLIVDQVNTNSLNQAKIIQYVKTRKEFGKNKMPLVMFTSGHYTPSQEWTNMQKKGFLCYKIIAMQVDDAVVSELRETRSLANDAISNDELLSVTTRFSRMIECLNHLELVEPNAREDDLRKAINPGAEVKLIREESLVHFNFLVWQKFIVNGVPKLEKLTDEDLKLEPGHVQYLGYLFSGNKDTLDTGINAILNSLEIMGEADYKHKGYTEFKHGSYFYKFSSKKSLHDVLRFVMATHDDISPAAKHNMLLAPFLMLSRENDSNLQSTRGNLLEMIIKNICDRETEQRKNPVGMRYSAGRLRLDDVDRTLSVSSVTELCRIPPLRDHMFCNEANSVFWYILNVPGKRPFKGFDFACMETELIEKKHWVKELQLFQVTINPKGKKPEDRKNMTKVIDEIIGKLKKNNLISQTDADNVVIPYFVDASEAREKKISLPRESGKSIEADVIGFPLKFLKLTTNEWNWKSLSHS